MAWVEIAGGILISGGVIITMLIVRPKLARRRELGAVSQSWVAQYRANNPL
jgi:hypothetical protein